MLFFLGAEFTKVYTRIFGSQLSDKLKAVPPTPENVVLNPSTGMPAKAGNSDIKGNLI
jgi:hypothetical protein